MPEVHFIGTIESSQDIFYNSISLSWSIVPGFNMKASLDPLSF